MINLVKIEKYNLDLAISIQKEIFPEHSALKDYVDSVNGVTSNVYWLIYEDNVPIGLSGIYYYNEYPESIWLGWFGVLESYRRKGYGHRILTLFEEEGRKSGYQYARLYTDKYDNDIAREFYKRNGYILEEYDNSDDIAYRKYPIVIYSKNLHEENNKNIEKWNNKNIKYTEQINSQFSNIL